ncbi:MAG: ABC transporter substrate-binding protein [Chloroflexi bacterium]|nr:ABC transporter substrate-binding protein [Chloroflexota bacterium]
MYSHNVRTAFGCLAALALVLSSCAPAAAPTPKPAAPPTAIAAKPVETAAAKPASVTATPKPVAEQPRYGGTIAISNVGDPPSLDMHQETTMYTKLVVAPAYNQLVEYQAHLGKGLFPGLAESWEVSKDGLVYTFNMRRGVKFHDGSTLTPQDAAFSLTRLWKPPSGVRSGLAGLIDGIKSIEAAGNQVKVTLEYPYSALVPMFAFNASVIYPQRVVEAKGDMKTTVVGTGPFRFKSYTAGVSVELVKNTDYWATGRPYLDGVVFYVLKDNMTRLAALRTGRVHMTGRNLATITPSEMETIKKTNPQMAIYPTTTPVYPWFFMNLRNKPFNDKRVRKALSLSIDRQAALKVIAGGYGSIARLFAVEGWGIPEDERLKLPGYRQPKDIDLAEARKLLGEAGYAQGFKLNILARTMRLSQDSAVFLTEQFARVGIESKVEVLEDAVFWDRGRRAQHEAMVYTPAMSVPDLEIMGRFLIKGASMNYSGNDDDAKINGLWAKQRAAVDDNQRKAAIEELERYVYEEAQPAIPLVVPYTFLAVQPEVRNFSPGISEQGNNNLQDIWLAK